MQALTAQGEIFQTYTFVRGLLDFPVGLSQGPLHNKPLDACGAIGVAERCDTPVLESDDYAPGMMPAESP